MKFMAIVILLSAWSCMFFAPSGALSRTLQLVLFGSLGMLLTLAGGFQYWWNSSMLPSEKSSLILLCGLGTLASQVTSLLKALMEEDGPEWPEPKSKRPWRK